MNPQRNIITQRTPCGDKRQRETQFAVNSQHQQTISPTFTYLTLSENCVYTAAKNNYNGQQQQETTTATANKQIIC